MIKNTLQTIEFDQSFYHPVFLPPKVGQKNFILIWQAPIVFFKKWCLSLLFIVMIKLQVRVLRLMKMHDYLNFPPCIICTLCIIWFRYGTGIVGLWAFRKYILLCVSHVHNKEYALLKKNRCIFLNILVWNIFSDLYVTCGPIYHAVMRHNSCAFLLAVMKFQKEFRLVTLIFKSIQISNISEAEGSVSHDVKGRKSRSLCLFA